jgi:hypothetical protein
MDQEAQAFLSTQLYRALQGNDKPQLPSPTCSDTNYALQRVIY